LLEWASDAVKAITTWVQEVSKTSPEILKWGTIVAGLAAVIGPALVALRLLATAVAAISAPVLAVGAAIAALAAAWVFWDDIKASFPATAAVIEGAIGVVIEVFTSLIEQVSNFARLAVQVFTGDFAAAADTLRTMFSTMGETVRNVFEIIMPGAFDEFVASAAQVKDRAIAAFQGMVDWFAALPATMKEIGTNIISGLWEGIQERWTAVKENIANIGSTIADSVKEHLGIKSP